MELLQYIVIIYYVCIVAHKCYIALAQSLCNNATAYYIVLIFNTINTHMDRTNEHSSACIHHNNILIMYYSRKFIVELLYFNSQKFPKGISFNKFCVKQ